MAETRALGKLDVAPDARAEDAGLVPRHGSAAAALEIRFQVAEHLMG